MLLMLQSLLEDRFQLKLHHETREGPVYELVIAKGGRRLKPARGCVPFDPNRLPRQTGPGETQVNYCGRMSRGGDDLRRTAQGTGVDITPRIGLLAPSLTGLLSEVLDRTVINKTGLIGAFEFYLEWAAQLTSPVQSDTEVRSIFAAVQEQLGLKLEASKGPVDFLVAARISRSAAEVQNFAEGAANGYLRKKHASWSQASGVHFDAAFGHTVSSSLGADCGPVVPSPPSANPTGNRGGLQPDPPRIEILQHSSRMEAAMESRRVPSQSSDRVLATSREPPLKGP